MKQSRAASERRVQSMVEELGLSKTKIVYEEAKACIARNPEDKGTETHNLKRFVEACDKLKIFE